MIALKSERNFKKMKKFAQEFVANKRKKNFSYVSN